MSSAMISSGRPVFITASSTGSMACTVEILPAVEQDVGIFEHGFLALGVGDEVRRQVALVELHALGELELGAERVRLLDRDHAVLADLVDRVGDDLADRRVGGRDGGDGGDVGPCRRLPWPAHLIDSTAAATAFSMPFFRPIGLAPAATLRMPWCTIAWASTVAVVVPSPATSLVLVATSFTSWAPMFSKGSSSSISLAMDTPSLVMVGAPNFLSSTTLRPFGPSVTLTVSANLFTPASRARRASSSNFSCFAMLVGQLTSPTIASTSRLVRISRSSPSMVTSVPPYLRVQDGVADLDVERGVGALVVAPAAGADGEDFALLRLLLGGVGDDQTGCGGLLGLVGLDDDAVIEGLEIHGCGPPLAWALGCGWDYVRR